MINASVLLAALISGSAVDAAGLVSKGAALYEQHCAVCHMPTGDGVPFMQPPLFDSPRANGKPGGVIDMIIQGSKAVPTGTSEYDNKMPGFEFLSDSEIAALASYVRTHFDNRGGSVDAELVAKRRARIR